ncbi:UDP-4-amino-4,6-dideoxy-N-acetyl-beta-L-altrosamine N-acetyltransferase [Neobacillus thermocopriae]|uniref:UDP-4-amino-4, 6-dideoxy-N-acetyl-beta-L-altrosamine N-acetyltransferase n=1 Tax=Neobacillus thermocopriae TaxID=1215031 RepID=A0A6B3TK97_9BACI|nr:UDP-4-amino-4,6-dideoxy-N-acetyl-beta-L-altrosamine N-acetyltransferase [Neobacillus thermocopriae]MED3622819.1 UDP-4-amino-4,6-dideoxy-N-acetyl-beta-L-altrosamine N-acetyltransferase [Neobacillus thermocopriae]MED3714723.1 UDP-4-amino-4,6-dideoxy-N-acetyl-beta-L-altrosamine N-acetyltransferase [Neobacillus thermocopriae]NEX77354.1 UDP-4-amino-4,6-dideoxy-N-acetyl-beta-L-altrosamine N-acetyltransferase [Neobacillus thermocopriae]
MNYFLRELKKEDKDILYKWRNKEEIRLHMFHSTPISYEQHVKWFENVLQHQSSVYRIFMNQNTPLGLVSFKINPQHQTCFWGFYVGEETAPKGTGSIMCSLALDYAFDYLKLRKVIGEVLAFNKKSIKLHQKLGFSQEGYFNKEIIRDGEFIDVIRFALFEEDWVNHKKQLNIPYIQRSD